MAVSSLSRMTVPLGSDQSAPSQGLLMPKLKYRFRATFQNFGISSPVTEMTKQVVSFDRPNVSFAEIPLPVYNSTIKVAGKYTWADTNCVIRDDSAGRVSQLIGEQLQKQLDFLEQSSASSGIDYKFTVIFEVLDGGNGIYAPIALETWQLFGCFLKSVNYGGMDYGQSEAATIALTLTYDNALQLPFGPGGAGVGATVGRTNGDVATGVGTAPFGI
jgi:hypothetical protein